MYNNGLFSPMDYGHTIEDDCVYYCEGKCSKGCNLSCGICRYYIKK